jgi:fructose-bisphosphate aldolase class II
MLVSLNKLLIPARKSGYAVGAFNFNNVEFTQAILAAAEEAGAPVILQTSEGAIKYLGFDYIGALSAVFKKAKVPVALHLDHGKDMDIIKQAIKSGFYTSVMIDGSSLPYEENVKMTKAVVKLARPKKISVEAELGVLKGKEEEISSAEHYFTDPKQAADFVGKTGCDALAVAVGTSHGAYKFSGSAKLDLRRLDTIRRLVKIPLVLHGASGVLPRLLDLMKKDCEKIGDCGRLSGAQGVPDEQIQKAIKLGVAKINIDTDLRIAFTAAIRNKILSDSKFFDPREYLKAGREEVKRAVLEKIKLFGE